jgi:hypothetical protein
MKSKKLLTSTFPLLMLFGIFPSAPARAAEVEQLSLSLNAGASVYSNMDPISTSVGLGLDAAFRFNNGFGIMGTTQFNLPAKGQLAGGWGDVDVWSVQLGILPTYTVAKESMAMSLGLGVGTWILNTKSTSAALAGGNDSRLTFLAALNVTFDITDRMFLGLSLRYGRALNGATKPSYISPMGSVGLKF